LFVAEATYLIAERCNCIRDTAVYQLVPVQLVLARNDITM